MKPFPRVMKDSDIGNFIARFRCFENFSNSKEH